LLSRSFLHFLAKAAASGVFQSRHALMACMKVNSTSSPCGILKAVRQGQKFEPIADKNSEPIENIATAKKSGAV
jgi:hypothetical protein